MFMNSIQAATIPPSITCHISVSMPRDKLLLFIVLQAPHNCHDKVHQNGGVIKEIPLLPNHSSSILLHTEQL